MIVTVRQNEDQQHDDEEALMKDEEPYDQWFPSAQRIPRNNWTVNCQLTIHKQETYEIATVMMRELARRIWFQNESEWTTKKRLLMVDENDELETVPRS